MKSPTGGSITKNSDALSPVSTVVPFSIKSSYMKMPKLYRLFSMCFSLGYYKLSVSTSELRAGVRVIDDVSYMVVFLLLKCNDRYHLSCRSPSVAKRRSTHKVKEPSELSASHRSSPLESPKEQDESASRQVPVASCSRRESVFPQQVLLVFKNVFQMQ